MNSPDFDFAARIIRRYHRWLANDFLDLRVGSGWHYIIGHLFEMIDLEMQRLPHLKITIHAIKEKFGGLRFQYRISEEVPPQIHDIVDKHCREAEELAWVTCEICGALACLRLHDSCYMTRCDQHAPPSSHIVPEAENRATRF
jgi:hypothetical protein